jgi:hypothetical protein
MKYSNFMVERLTLLLRIREDPFSNLGQENGYAEVVRGFPQFLQVNTGIAPKIVPNRILRHSL